MTIFYNPDSPLMDQLGIGQKIVDELQYISYCNHREENPDLPPSALAGIFEQWQDYEKRYANETEV